jgi:hypothetical protein
MPDYIFGGSNEDERTRLRERLIMDSFHAWPQARVASAWMRASAQLEVVRQATLEREQAMKTRPRRMSR